MQIIHSAYNAIRSLEASIDKNVPGLSNVAVIVDWQEIKAMRILKGRTAQILAKLTFWPSGITNLSFERWSKHHNNFKCNILQKRMFYD